METNGQIWLKKPECQTTLVANELSGYDIDIAAIGQTRLPPHDSIAESEYTFFWSRREVAEMREVGIRSNIKNSIVQCLEQKPTSVNDRIITMRLPQKKNAYAMIISVYAVDMNPEDIKEGLYSTLRDIVKAVSITENLITAGDFKSKFGRDVAN